MVVRVEETAVFPAVRGIGCPIHFGRSAGVFWTDSYESARAKSLACGSLVCGGLSTLRPPNSETKLFFAFDQGWIHEEGDDRRFRAQDTKVSAKFQYSFRF